ncbi:MAG: DUF4382 domain-containing protein [Pseudomonadota bacterium]
MESIHNPINPGAAPWRVALACAGVAMLTACGGGGSATVDNDAPIAEVEQGTLYVGLTDAEGDFDSYLVDVMSLRLERANGTTVETIPLETRVDFAELTEVTELLSIATVPAGNYVAASLRLDFTDSQVIVQDENGVLSEAVVVDPDGAALGEYEVRLALTSSDTIRIAPGIPASFSLDFDLDASNTIDDTVSPAVVTVEPFIIATPELEEDREHRVRGVLESVDEAAASATLVVRPFFHRTGDFGRFIVNVDETTQYEVDGIGYTGADGLTALAALDPRTPVIANGDIEAREMAADTIVAGSSVPWADSPVVKGVVSARDLDTLTIEGASIEFEDGTVTFGGTFTVLLGEQTTVSAPGEDNADLTINSISVGQRVVAFGEAVDDLTFDASESRIVMQQSQLTGEVVQASPMAVDVFLLNGRRPARFDFSGTGMSAELDADPAFYEIDNGSLALTTVTEGDLVRVRGLVNDFGAAPADFVSRTVIDLEFADRPGELIVQWPLDAPSTTPFLSTAPDTLNVDISASREFLRIRGVPRPFTNPLDMLSILATEDGQGAYAINVRGTGTVTLYRNFADLEVALNETLASGAALQRIHARVGYTDKTDGLTSPRASFIFQPAGD